MKESNKFKILETKENFTPSGGASEDEISLLEEQLNVKLPEPYKDFLKQYGSAIWFGQSIYGIGEGPFPERFNLDTKIKTIHEREYDLPKEFSPFPDHCIVLNRYDGGGNYVLFCENSHKKGRVVLIDHSQRGRIVESWTDFNQWFKYISQF